MWGGTAQPNNVQCQEMERAHEIKPLAATPSIDAHVAFRDWRDCVSRVSLRAQERGLDVRELWVPGLTWVGSAQPSRGLY